MRLPCSARQLFCDWACAPLRRNEASTSAIVNLHLFGAAPPVTSGAECAHRQQTRRPLLQSGRRGSVKRRIRDRGNPEGVAETRDGSFLAIGDAECGRAISMSPKHRVYCGLKAAPEADGNEQILWTEQADFLLKITSRHNRSFRVMPQRREAIRQQ